MAIKDTDILDLLATTEFEQHKNKWTFLATKLQDFLFFDMMSKRQNIVMQTGSLGLERTIMNGSGGSSRWVGLYEPDQVNIQDLLRKMRVEWTHLTDACAYERREFEANSGKYIINDVIKPRRQDTWVRMISTLEESFFGVPDAANTNQMFGLFYWLVPNATQGFNGGYAEYTGATNFTNVAGVDLTQTPNFKNWTDTYSAVTKDDLIAKMRKAFRRTKWKSPISASEFTSETGSRRMILTTEGVLEQLERVGESQNENLGRDLASMDGNILFKKTPIMWCPQFDDEGFDYSNTHASELKSPIAMVDLDSFFVFVSSSDNFHKTEQKDPKCHNQYNEFFDLSLNTFCNNRRANAILTYA
jgi:hypothetical protein